MTQHSTHAEHWQFSLAVYTQEDVARHCLALQDRVGLDVNMLLMMLWAASCWRHAPTTEQIAQADSLVQDWREEVILPLRKLRTRLKTGPAPAPDAITSELRENIKRLELEAERTEQDVLAEWVREQKPLSRLPVESSLIGSGLKERVDEDYAQVESDVAEEVDVDNVQADSGLSKGIEGVGEVSAREDRENSRGSGNSVNEGYGGNAEVSVNEVSSGTSASNSADLQAVLEQTAVRVVGFFEGRMSGAHEEEIAAHAADPWLALQHAHEVVVAAAQVVFNTDNGLQAAE